MFYHSLIPEGLEARSRGALTKLSIYQTAVYLIEDPFELKLPPKTKALSVQLLTFLLTVGLIAIGLYTFINLQSEDPNMVNVRPHITSSGYPLGKDTPAPYPRGHLLVQVLIIGDDFTLTLKPRFQQHIWVASPKAQIGHRTFLLFFLRY